MRVSEGMTPAPGIGADQPVGRAAARMVRLEVRHLPVVDSGGRLIGLVTDAVVFQHGGFLDWDREWVATEPRSPTVGEVALPADVVLGPDQPIEEAMERLASTPQDALVVVDVRGCPVGIVTEHDLLGPAADRLDPEEVAAEVGSAPVFTVPALSPAQDALDEMLRRGIRHVVVTRSGAVDGVVSLRDLVLDDAARRPDLLVEECVRAEGAFVAHPETPLRALAAMMRDERIGAVPIVDADRHPLRIVTRRDVIERALASRP